VCLTMEGVWHVHGKCATDQAVTAKRMLSCRPTVFEKHSFGKGKWIVAGEDGLEVSSDSKNHRDNGGQGSTRKP